MNISPDAASAMLTPSRDDLDRLLHLVDHPTGDVIEDPIELLRTRTLLTMREFALVMNVSRTTAYEMVATGEFETMRVGKSGIRVLAQPLALLLGDVCPHCGREGGAS